MTDVAAYAPRPDQGRKEWLDTLRVGDEVDVAGMGRHRLATVVMRLDSGDLLVSGGVVFDGKDGEDSRREFWILPVEEHSNG